MNTFSLSGAFCLHNKVCVLEQTDDSVLIGMVHAEDGELMDKISAAFVSSTDGKGMVHFMPVTEDECLRHITGTIAGETEVREDAPDYSPAVSRQTADISSPAVNLLDNIVLEAVSRNASDIHLEPYAEPAEEEIRLRVRFRAAGQLVFYRMFESAVFEQLVRRIKVLASLNVSETRQCQDGKFIWQSAEETDSCLKIDVRVSCIPVWNGESVVLRLLRTLEEPPTLAELGFSEHQQGILERIMDMNSRLVIVAGPTGAGKTTTLAALLAALSDEGKKIVTVEDPVEYRIPGVTQIEVREEGGLDFQEVLKRVFRHDPDVLMIGEIRDEETARTAVRAALTGHLVFATMHALNACSAALRLSELGIPGNLLSSVLGAVIAQKLVPCPELKTGRFAGRMLCAEILEESRYITSCLSHDFTEWELENTMHVDGMQRIEDDEEAKMLLLTGKKKKAKKKKTTWNQEEYRDW